MKIDNLRKKYPRFVYEKYSYKISGNNLEIFFDFSVEPNIKFQPKIIIENVSPELVERIGDSVLNNLILNLGLIEMISYWKATCSPIIEIKAGALNSEQIKYPSVVKGGDEQSFIDYPSVVKGGDEQSFIDWWKDLIMKGMGQFFYENKINFRSPDFLTIKTPPLFVNLTIVKLTNMKKNKCGVLVPVGGGKDSVVTLELLKKARKNIQCFSLNPTEAAQKIIKMAGCRNPIIIKREIDKKLLELNQKGFLNGHTPFSAYLAFLSVLVTAISGQKHIAFSNERSSNEGNVKYLGKIINHQWSKSFEFEKKFRSYTKKYLVKNIEYFSFLRPLYEIQIAKLFSRFPKYFNAFLSCNEAYKTVSGTKKPSKKWCGKCSKCLFVFTILYPFVGEKELLRIFGKNLFENKKLLPIMQELIGKRGFKPFECVGTKKESLAAFYLSLTKKLRSWEIWQNRKLPILLDYFRSKILPKYPNLKKESEIMMNSWNKQNDLPKMFQYLTKLK